ncbi:hypothetical protein NLI96_g12892 [Meripilus lineatus]|uniref:OmpR/PhoB-type domain-containing protein n=1 Tax=Meripilus lineatus TaxID=2056292 RepID=A0AAD5Y9G2_9APHY|nr:hypothetical protein NLI96_g12892 [Physisporinus lineatus]
MFAVRIDLAYRPASPNLAVENRMLRIGSLDVSLSEKRVFLDGKRIHLVTKEAIFRRVWPKTQVQENNLQVHISGLRKLMSGDRHLLKTVPGRGYCLLTPDVDGCGTRIHESVKNGRNRFPLRASPLVGRAEDLASDVISAFDAAAYRADHSGDAPPAETTTDHDRGPMIVIVDNCEHVATYLADVIDELLTANQHLRILATSREPLKLPGETLYWVRPLSVRADSASDELSYLPDATRLFLHRIRNFNPTFPFSPANIDLVDKVCRRLDGLPFAINLAAMRAASRGIQHLMCELDMQAFSLKNELRTVVDRHQTLSASCEWSCRLLSDAERQVLGRLAVFPGRFQLEVACAVIVDPVVSADDIAEQMASLQMKSLLIADQAEGAPSYALLNTTRAYASRLLIPDTERIDCMTRYAEYLSSRFSAGVSDSLTRPAEDRVRDFSRFLEDIRALLDWCFSTSGSESAGVRLTVASIPYLFELALLRECQIRIGQTMRVFKAREDVDRRLWSCLQAWHATVGTLACGSSVDMAPVWGSLNSLSKDLDDRDLESRAIAGQWDCMIFEGDIARQNLSSKWLMGASFHYSGDQDAARIELEHMLSVYDPFIHRWGSMGSMVEHRVLGHAFHARVLWLQGETCRALKVLRAANESATSKGNPILISHVLLEAMIPLAVLAEDYTTAATALAKAQSLVEQYDLELWRNPARCFQLLLASPADFVIPEMRTAIAQLKSCGAKTHMPMFRAHLATLLGRMGLVEQAHEAVEEGLAEAEASGNCWLNAELNRVRGNLAMTQCNDHVAEQAYMKAEEIATTQAARWLQLRSATALANIWAMRGEQKKAQDWLRRFTGGEPTRHYPRVIMHR